MGQTAIPITIEGRYFWKGKDRFLVRGVVYKPLPRPKRREQWTDNDFTRFDQHSQQPPVDCRIDPLTDDEIENLSRDLSLFKELGLNTLFVYNIDSNQKHDKAMGLLALAGIYVFAVLSETKSCINRMDPHSSYHSDLLQAYFRRIDCLAAYPNTLGVMVANEVINSAPSSVSADVIRAVVRDTKRYMKLKSDMAGQRVLPVGVSVAAVTSYRKSELEFMMAGPSEEGIDFYSFNCYSWCGKSSFQISGYAHLVRMLSDTPIPLFFSQYGTNMYRTRAFHETRCIYSPEMTGIFSGGVVYEFFEGLNRYGLVKFQDDGDLVKLDDFENYKKSLEASTDPPNTLSEWASNETTAARRPTSFPAQSDRWRATGIIPECPLDWDNVAEFIEEDEWVVVTDKVTGDLGQLRLELSQDTGHLVNLEPNLDA